MLTKLEVKQQFYMYLSNQFGPKFIEMIEPPKGVEIGERVLYKLRNQLEAQRREMTQKEIDEFQQMLNNIAEKNGAVLAETRPATSSGLPFPRVVDIIDWSEVAMDVPAKEYLVSQDILPKIDFSIEWLFGLVLGPSNKRLVYIDFTHPKVKAVFSAEYDCEYDYNAGKAIPQQLQLFKEERAKIISQVELKPEILWAKILQLENQILVQYKNNL